VGGGVLVLGLVLVWIRHALKSRQYLCFVLSCAQYAYQPMDYDATYSTVRSALLDGVFGPPKGGVYSPSVQYTL
jgi:hypothetical protein